MEKESREEGMEEIGPLFPFSNQSPLKSKRRVSKGFK